MNNKRTILAIGRSRYMYDSIRYLASKGYHFAAIVTEKAYDEYDIKEEHFQQLANELGSPFFCTGNLNVPELIELVNRENVQIAISANWRYKVPKKFLELFGCGIFNYHLGNLPDYNGNATINWTLVHGLDYINGNIHKMDPELDSGDIVVRDSIRIEESDYVNDVMKKAQAQVPGLFEKALDLLWANPAHYELKGSSSGSRCFPRLPEDSQIDWTKPAHEIYCLIRASAEPYDGAYTYLNGEKVIVWRAQPYYPPYEFYAIPGHVVSVSKEAGVLVACGKGMLRLQKIESNGNSMAAEDQIKSIRLRFKYNHNG